MGGSPSYHFRSSAKFSGLTKNSRICGFNMLNALAACFLNRNLDIHSVSRVPVASMLLVHSAYWCCISILHACPHCIHAACSWCMSMPHIHSACMSGLHVNAACSRSMSMVHVIAVCPCRTSLLIVLRIIFFRRFSRNIRRNPCKS